jgi:phosphoglycerol transferase MdoB-like AlkP superfamily enzyme
MSLLHKYTYATAVYGSKHDYDAVWKAHDVERTLPALGLNQEEQKSDLLKKQQLCNAIVYLDKNKITTPLIEAERIEEKSNCIVAFHWDHVVFHTTPQVNEYPIIPNVRKND